MKKYMKKSLLVIFLSVFLIGKVFSIENTSSKTVAVMNSKFESVSQTEQSWLGGAIKDKFESNLRTYSEFRIVNLENAKEITALQRKMESSAYDEKSVIEQGKLLGANYALFPSVRKSGKYYILSGRFVDLKTGETLSSVIAAQVDNTENLWINSGCAIDLLTIQMFEQLGIYLSEDQKYILRHGQENLTVTEQLENARREEKEFKNIIAKYDSEIANLKKSAKTDSTSEIAKLNAEKILVDEKLKASQIRSERLLQMQKQKELDEKQDAKRNEAQKAQRDKLIKQIEKKSGELQKQKSKTESVYGQIMTLENKKRALEQINAQVQEYLTQIEKEANDDYTAKKNRILKAEYRAAELVDGKPTKEAVERRNNQVENERKIANNEIQGQIAQVKKSVTKNQKSLLAEISADKKNLTKTKSASSLTEELKISFGEFDAQKQCWKVYVYFYFNGNLFFKTVSQLKYSDLIGKNVNVSAMDENEYQEFLNNVDLYSSLFARGENLVWAKLLYRVCPDNREASCYNFNFESLEFFDILSGKKIETNAINESAKFTVKPSITLTDSSQMYKFHIKSETELAHEAELKAKEKQRLAAQKARENLKKQRLAYLDASQHYQFETFCDVLLVPHYDGVWTVFGLGFDWPLWKNIFWGVDAGACMMNNTSYYWLPGSGYYFPGFVQGEIGVNFNIKPLINTYFSCGAGMFFGEYFDVYTISKVGISVALFKLDYQVRYNLVSGIAHGISFGVGFYPNGNKTYWGNLWKGLWG